MMKRTLLFLLLTFVPLFALEAKDYEVRSPQTDKCPIVILMHGIFSSKDYNPMPALAFSSSAILAIHASV